MELEAGQLVKFRGNINALLGVYRGPSPKNKDRSLVYWLQNEHTSDPMTELLEVAEA